MKRLVLCFMLLAPSVVVGEIKKPVDIPVVSSTLEHYLNENPSLRTKTLEGSLVKLNERHALELASRIMKWRKINIVGQYIAGILSGVAIGFLGGVILTILPLDRSEKYFRTNYQTEDNKACLHYRCHRRKPCWSSLGRIIF